MQNIENKMEFQPIDSSYSQLFSLRVCYIAPFFSQLMLFPQRQALRDFLWDDLNLSL